MGAGDHIAIPKQQGLADAYLMRQEAQNDRQLRLALKLYWQMQKEDAALAARPGEETEESDGLLAELEKSLEVDPSSETPKPEHRCCWPRPKVKELL